MTNELMAIYEDIGSGNIDDEVTSLIMQINETMIARLYDIQGQRFIYARSSNT